MPYDYTTKHLHTGRRISVDLDTVCFPDGSSGTLEVVRHPGAAAVIPFLDPPRDADPRILLLRQFRHAASGLLWEIPAGTLDGTEDPVSCARRELEEEAGATAGRFEHLTTIFTTPGFTDERIHLFLATDLTRVPSRLEADEFIEVHEVRWSTALDLLREGGLVDAKSMTALLYVESFHRSAPPGTTLAV